MKILSYAAAAALCLASGANAITYFGSLTVGGSTATYSIVTDGTLGQLAQSNILSSSGSVTHGAASASFVNGDYNREAGTSVTATATQIWFDATQLGALVIGNYPSSFTGVCFSGGGAACDVRFGSVVMVGVAYPTDFEYVASQGRYLVASTAAVPEPASWALMIAGFGMTGAALRRRVRMTA